MYRFFTFFLFFSFLIEPASGQSVSKSAFQELEYRLIGPFRAGRTVGAVGIPNQPNVFFIGVNNGGIWKTDDYGRTWKPIFDQTTTGSVGDIAVSPTNTKIIFVGTGEGLHRPDLSTGDGVFKSVDGGVTWTFCGLGDVQQIGRIIIHPTDPNIVFVAGLGHPYGANEERGVFRTLDGGKTWQKVLYLDKNTGAIQVEFDPNNPKIIYADLWEHREGPWENASFSGKKSGLFKSVDGGTTWKKLTAGLPNADEGLGRIGFGIAPGNSKIMYATVDATLKGGIYKSIDAGESWNLVNSESRLWGRGSDFADIRIHPRDPNKIFVANTASYQSNDGGKSWTSLKGAPGGDDYHRIWINPIYPDIMLFAADQGATITVNGGKTWSSWYNQPTAQLYHVSTDNQFPYWVYGGQQESGAIGVSSRGPGGQISFRDWMGVGADEYAYVAADPLNPEYIYGGKLIKFNKKTGQSQNIAPETMRSGKYRMLRTMPLLFHPADPHTLLFATNVLWKTTNGGDTWEIISPDLSREKPEVPESIGDFRTAELSTMSRRGVIYSIAASPLHTGTIWAGTDDGLIHLTEDGGEHWKNVSPGTLKSWDKISQIDAGHFDRKTAYMSINSFRKDDLKPHIYKTHDGGLSWTEIVNGLGSVGAVNVIREDSEEPGLLYAGTEREVYFSVDDGAHWQSLRNNMPATSIRDLVVKDNDLVIGTHGRSIWILDNIAPLRQLAKALKTSNPFLFAPPTAFRVRDNMFHDTPLPPEEPTGQNPPDGAIIDYLLPNAVAQISIDILDDKGQLIRHFAHDQKAEKLADDLPYPTYWIKINKNISVQPGHHRLIWDLRHEPLAEMPLELTIAAVYQKTPTSPVGPYVHPGQYTVRLNVDNMHYEQKLRVKLDPRVNISAVDLEAQTEYSMQCYRQYHELESLKSRARKIITSIPEGLKKSELESLIGYGDPVNPDILYSSISAARDGKETIVSLQTKYLYVLAILQSADAAPTNQTKKTVQELSALVHEINKKIK